MTGPEQGDVAERFSTGSWAFTPEVVEVFDDHVRASVPHYDVIQDLVAAAAGWLIPNGGTYADLGASTGTTADLIRRALPDREIQVVLYDEAPEMLEKAKARLAEPLVLSTDPIERGPYAHSSADLTTALFTLQFLTPEDRLLTLLRARAASAPSGALLVAEKVRPADSRWAEIANDLSHDWKASHGISDAAIRAKARALRGVLRPCSETALAALITAAGWTAPETIFRWHNWVLVGAFATPSGWEE